MKNLHFHIFITVFETYYDYIEMQIPEQAFKS